LSDLSATGRDQFIGSTRLANGTPITGTDIAVAPDGRAYLVSFTDLYAIDTSTAIATPIGSGAFNGLNALTSDNAGHLWAASRADGSFYRINRHDGSATLVGQFGSDWVSSGDLTFDAAGRLWAAARRLSDRFDTLVTVDVLTGAAAERGTLPLDVFGLTFVGDTLYAFSASTNGLYVVDPARGTANLVRSLSFSPYGATRVRR
jgi:sugar lactone lactonase YvrE